MLASGAELADEAGIGSVGLAALAERLGVKAPALYKHIDGIGGLQHRIATLAMTELGDALRDALQGKSGADAIDALRCTIHSFALLQAANAFQWGNDPDESVAWMIRKLSFPAGILNFESSCGVCDSWGWARVGRRDCGWSGDDGCLLGEAGDRGLVGAVCLAQR